MGRSEATDEDPVSNLAEREPLKPAEPGERRRIVKRAREALEEIARDPGRDRSLEVGEEPGDRESGAGTRRGHGHDKPLKGPRLWQPATRVDG